MASEEQVAAPVQTNMIISYRSPFSWRICLARRVEVVTPEALSPYIGPYILEEVEYAPLGA